MMLLQSPKEKITTYNRKIHNQLTTIVSTIEKYCKENNIDHRFVGSVSFGGLLTEQTKYTIFINKKLIQLRNHRPLIMIRDDQTIRDIDIILFCNDKEKIKKFKHFFTQLKKQEQYFPLISFEATIYPSFGKRNSFLQFVTALEVDEKNQLSLAFEHIKQKISWESIEPWHVLLEGGITYTTRNPIADYYAYLFRSPSGMKPKDADKLVQLQKLKHAVIEEGEKYHINYVSDTYFGAWENFIKQLETTTNIRILAKKHLIKLYWKTIGTYLAHGKGAGKILLAFSNQFTGIKQ